MERLGLGPGRAARRQSEARLRPDDRLGAGRAAAPHAAGHDINYIALVRRAPHRSAATAAPSPPVNYVGDFGGGGMMLAFGMVSALLAVQERRRGPGDRLRDDRRLGPARQPDLGPLRRGPVEGRDRRQPHRQRRAWYDTYDDRRRQMDRDRRDRAAILRHAIALSIGRRLAYWPSKGRNRACVCDAHRTSPRRVAALRRSGRRHRRSDRPPTGQRDARRDVRRAK